MPALNPKSIKYLLVSMYVAGLIGLNLPQTAHIFKLLTPFNLVASVILLIYFHEEWNKNTIIFFIGTVLFGFLIEVIGVKTGKIFGHYEYQTTLGFKTLDVPPLIGLNWFMLVYCTGSVIKKPQNNISRAVLGAIFLTAFDFIAEPIAIKLEMWHWYGQLPPLQNYIGWFIVSLLLLLLFESLKLKKTNSIAPILLILQILFFGIQRIFIIFF